MNILLDYFFPIASIESTPSASTGFLKQALLLVKPKSGVTPGTIIQANTIGQVSAVTDNTEATQLFNAGMGSVFILPLADLDLSAELVGHESDFFTVLVSSDFDDAEIVAMDVGNFKGVVGVSSTDDTFLAIQSVILNRVAFHTTASNKAKNMLYAFGKMLSNQLSWRNQQYITMPYADDVSTLGQANSLFTTKTSFVLSDSEFGTRLGLFAVGGKAIVAPYIKKNLELDIQSRALTYISGNQPSYSMKHAALLEDELQKVVENYIDREWIENGKLEVKLEQSNFIASGYINISEPKALWRIFGEIKQTL